MSENTSNPMSPEQILQYMIAGFPSLGVMDKETAEVCIKHKYYLEAAVTWVKHAQKTREFYRTVAKLTKDHDVIGEDAVVFPSRLGAALEKVNPNWAEDEGTPASL